MLSKPDGLPWIVFIAMLAFCTTWSGLLIVGMIKNFDELIVIYGRPGAFVIVVAFICFCVFVTHQTCFHELGDCPKRTEGE